MRTEKDVEAGSDVLADADAFAVRILLVLVAFQLAHRFSD